jgi:hypothetical protein
MQLVSTGETDDTKIGAVFPRESARYGKHLLERITYTDLKGSMYLYPVDDTCCIETGRLLKNLFANV